jgi:hypothetical protein
MDQDAGKDASGWKQEDIKKNLSFDINFGKVIQIHVWRKFWGYSEEDKRNLEKYKKNQGRNATKFG